MRRDHINSIRQTDRLTVVKVIDLRRLMLFAYMTNQVSLFQNPIMHANINCYEASPPGSDSFL